MGRITATIDVQNPAKAGSLKKMDVLVDTGACYLTLPLAWKKQFGPFESEATVELQTATQEVVSGTVCGPVKIKVEGFRPIYNEVLFLNMEPADGEYEPLLGYIVLEQCGAAVDMLGHRLVPVRHMDAKSGVFLHQANRRTCKLNSRYAGRPSKESLQIACLSGN